ncbi:MAG: hypothetical protein ABIR16_08115 [Dokdonella sp.]
MFRSPFSIALFSLCFAVLACASTSAYAVQTYCVSSVTQLRNALVDAETDADDSYIKIRTGTYEFFTELRYEPTAEFILPAGNLTVEGGYNTGCTSRVDDARLTTVRSGASQQFALFTQTGSVSVKTLTLDQTELRFAGGILGDSCASNSLKFEGRRLRSTGGKLYTLAQCHDIVLRDSVFASPADGTALEIYINQNNELGSSASLTMVNNTVAEGRLFVSSCCDFRGTAYLYNNVFRNSGTEIAARATNVLALNNRYDSLVFSADTTLPAGTLQVGSTDNVSSNPNLDADYRPNANSVMVNSGTSTVPGGLLSIDLYGGTRVIGSAVDRGAVESPVDGSGVFTVTNANASGAGSLADAVNLANADSGFNQIKFNIPGSCPRRIVLPTTLYLRDYVRLDGWSQPGSVQNDESVLWNAKPCVILDGNGIVSAGIETGSQLGNGLLTIRGLAFEGFSTAIVLTFGNGSAIHGNQFGGRIGDSGPILAGNGTAILTGLSAVNTLIGGSEDAQANLIGSSTTTGVAVQSGSTGNQIVGNRIGIDKNFAGNLPNLDGIRISTANNSVRDNYISRNTRDGVVLTNANANGNVIRDNLIGGNSGLFGTPGNGRMGVLIDNDAHDNTIGPDNALQRNGDSGVRLLAASGGRNRISQNSMDANDSPGIDLGANGVSPNDPDPQFCIPTLGCAANRGQNFPVMTEAVRVRGGFIPTGKPILVKGSLTTTFTTAPYRIEFFGSDTCYSEGNGQGTRYLGFADIVVSNSGFCSSGNCNKTFQTYMSELNVDIGDVITTTATSPDGNTSEFSACMVVTDQDDIFANGFD